MSDTIFDAMSDDELRATFEPYDAADADEVRMTTGDLRELLARWDKARAALAFIAETPATLAALDRAAEALAREEATAQAEPLVVLSCPPCEDSDDPQRTHPAGAWVLDAVTHDHGNEARAPTEREARALLAARLRATAQRLEREP